MSDKKQLDDLEDARTVDEILERMREYITSERIERINKMSPVEFNDSMESGIAEMRSIVDSMKANNSICNSIDHEVEDIRTASEIIAQMRELNDPARRERMKKVKTADDLNRFFEQGHAELRAIVDRMVERNNADKS